MRKSIGLTFIVFAFFVGLLGGAIDRRTGHIAIAPARAEPRGGGSGGCDGHGAFATCAACSNHSCIAVCVGSPACSTWFYGRGLQACGETAGNCASGGTTLVGTSGL
jgi:hypothetical protein